MRDILIDLYRHQEWADAEIWRAGAAHPPAWTDGTLFERQHHIHLVQQAFFAVITGVDLSRHKFTRPGDYANPGELKDEARRFHQAATSFLHAATPADLDRKVIIPWFKEPSLEITVAEALMQAAMHSHYHRGQQATRLRELGGTPPLTDYIVWLWKGKAPADWT